LLGAREFSLPQILHSHGGILRLQFKADKPAT
jgi:hypothetical protein